MYRHGDRFLSMVGDHGIEIHRNNLPFPGREERGRGSRIDLSVQETTLESPTSSTEFLSAARLLGP